MTEDYRQVLRLEFESRQRTNPSYSLRAFARDLKVPTPKERKAMKSVILTLALLVPTLALAEPGKDGEVSNGSTRVQTFFSQEEIENCIKKESGLKKIAPGDVRKKEFVVIPKAKLAAVLKKCGFEGQKDSITRSHNDEKTEIGAYVSTWDPQEPHFPSWPSIVTYNDKAFYLGSYFRTIHSVVVGHDQGLVVERNSFSGGMIVPGASTIALDHEGKLGITSIGTLNGM